MCDTDFQDSGPFCRHYSDPCDCSEVCDTCGHRCSEHDTGEGGTTECNVNGCKCTEWKDQDG